MQFKGGLNKQVKNKNKKKKKFVPIKANRGGYGKGTKKYNTK